MKIKLTLVSCIVLFLSLILASQSSSQEPALDLGETSSLIVGCDYIRNLIEAENYSMKYCRVREPEEATANEIKLKLIVRDNYYPRPVKIVEMRLRKSLWQVESLKIVG